MRAQVNLKELRNALALVSAAISTRSSLPVLHNALLTVEGDCLRLQATNLDLTLTAEIRANATKDGAVTLPAKPLAEWLASVQSADVALELTERTQTVALTAGNAKAQLKGITAADYPQIVRPPDDDAEWQKFSLPARDMAALVERVAYAAATDMGRPTLTGVLLTLNGGTMKLAATDGYRLATGCLPLPDAPAGKMDLLVPGNTLRLLGKICGQASESALVTFHVRTEGEESGPGIIWRIAGEGSDGLVAIELGSSLLSGKYPDYSAIIPKSHTTRVVLSAAEFAAALRCASPFSSIMTKEMRSLVKLTLGDGVTVAAANDSVGEGETHIACTVEGAALVIACNGDYLTDALAGISGNLVAQFTTPNRPIMIYPEGADPSDGLAVIMPTHTK